MNALVSIIIPVCNIEQHLQECLDSVTAQTLHDIEIICVDDGSTDSSPCILAEYAARDSRFRVIRQENAGPGAARNRGLQETNGKYLIFLDSDDWFEPDFLQSMVQNAERTGADVTICRADEFDTNTQKVWDGKWMLKTEFLPGSVFAPETIAPYVFQFTYGMAWDKLYRADYIRENGFRYPALLNSEDLVFVFPTILCARRIGVVDQVFIHHRVNRQSSVSNSRTRQPDAPYEAFRMVFDFLEKRELLGQYQQSFVNWAMDFLVWHVSNIGDRKIQQAYYRKLREIWFPRLRFEQYPRSYFMSRTVYCKYLLAKYAPYPFFAAVVKVYKACKGR